MFVSAKEQVFVDELVVGERCLNLRIDPTHRREVSVSGIDDPRSAGQSVPEIVVTSANGMGCAASSDIQPRSTRTASVGEYEGRDHVISGDTVLGGKHLGLKRAVVGSAARTCR